MVSEKDEISEARLMQKMSSRTVSGRFVPPLRRRHLTHVDEGQRQTQRHRDTAKQRRRDAASHRQDRQTEQAPLLRLRVRPQVEEQVWEAPGRRDEVTR
jgi:hypothetical protein